MTRFAYLAILVYLVPLAVTVFVRARRDRALWEIALDLPFAVAVDMVSVLLLTRVMTLESALLVSRPLWIAGGIALRARAWFGARSSSSTPRSLRVLLPQYPAALTLHSLTAVCIAATIGWWLSARVSHQCHTADRAWHIPLSSSLRGQGLPFSNVYEPGVPLGYHFSGDVMGAMFQVFSGDHLHASLGLSLAHDVSFALTAAAVALFVQSFGIERIAYAVLFGVAVLLASPLTLMHADHGHGESGYSFVDLYRLSFRPHVPLAELLIFGFFGALAARIGRTDDPPPLLRTAPVLLASTAALAITDEASVGILGLALGGTWLFAPDVIHPKRTIGMGVLVGLLFAVVLPSLLLGGSMGPGAPKHHFSWVPWRAPGYLNAALDLTKKPEGWWYVFWDFFPFGATALGGVLTLRRRSRGLWPSVFFYSALLALATVLLLRADVDKQPVESHRFMTAPMFLFPVVAALWLGGRFPFGSNLRRPGATTQALLIGSMAVSSICSLESMRSWGKSHCTKPSAYASSVDFFTIDCADYIPQNRGGAMLPEYVEEHLLYNYGGCNPTYVAGPPRGEWEVKVGLARFGRGAFEELNASMIPKGSPLRMVCPENDRAARSDVACAYAMDHDLCEMATPKVRTCDVTAVDRNAILRQWSSPKQAPARGAHTSPDPESDGSRGLLSPAEDGSDH